MWLPPSASTVGTALSRPTGSGKAPRPARPHPHPRQEHHSRHRRLSFCNKQAHDALRLLLGSSRAVGRSGVHHDTITTAFLILSLLQTVKSAKTPLHLGMAHTWDGERDHLISNSYVYNLKSRHVMLLTVAAALIPQYPE